MEFHIFSMYLVHVLLQPVAGIHTFTLLLIFLLIAFGLVQHALNLVLAETALLVLDLDPIGFAGGFVLQMSFYI